MEHNEKKRIAILQPFIGNVNRGNETFFMEIANFLKQYYEIDIYGTNTDESVKDMMTVVDCKMGALYHWYENLYNRSPRLIKLLNCSRYAIIFQPLVFFNRKFSKTVYKKHLSKKKYDLLFPGNGTEAVRQCIRYRRKHGTPVIYKGGGGIGPGEWWTLKCKPDKYICISSKQFAWAKQYYDQVCMIPNGVTLSRFKTGSAGKKFCINKDHKLVISVGHLDKNFKRHQLTIHAVAQLQNVDLLLLGEGEAEGEFKELAEQEIPGRWMIKRVNYMEVAGYYRSADLFALPSREEPFGIVYIEAMACGLPVIGTDDEVRREIIGDAGLVCDVENKVEYAETIKTALDRDWGDKPQKRAELYDYQIVGEKYHQLIEQVICQHPYHE